MGCYSLYSEEEPQNQRPSSGARSSQGQHVMPPSPAQPPPAQLGLIPAAKLFAAQCQREDVRHVMFTGDLESLLENTQKTCLPFSPGGDVNHVPPRTDVTLLSLQNTIN